MTGDKDIHGKFDTVSFDEFAIARHGGRIYDTWHSLNTIHRQRGVLYEDVSGDNDLHGVFETIAVKCFCRNLMISVYCGEKPKESKYT